MQEKLSSEQFEKASNAELEGIQSGYERDSVTSENLCRSSE